jgi:hypothetical protein
MREFLVRMRLHHGVLAACAVLIQCATQRTLLVLIGPVNTEDMGAEGVKTADWSDNVAPFWNEVVDSAFTPSGVSGLLTAGWETMKGAMVMPMMQRGYQIGLIKFVAITGSKPTAWAASQAAPGEEVPEQEEA